MLGLCIIISWFKRGNYLWCFNQLSFWRHPFTAEDPLVSNWSTVMQNFSKSVLIRAYCDLFIYLFLIYADLYAYLIDGLEHLYREITSEKRDDVLCFLFHYWQCKLIIVIGKDEVQRGFLIEPLRFLICEAKCSLSSVNSLLSYTIPWSPLGNSHRLLL